MCVFEVLWELQLIALGSTPVCGLLSAGADGTMKLPSALKTVTRSINTTFVEGERSVFLLESHRASHCLSSGFVKSSKLRSKS